MTKNTKSFLMDLKTRYWSFLVWNIINLEHLIQISNTGTFKFEDTFLIQISDTGTFKFKDTFLIPKIKLYLQVQRFVKGKVKITANS